MTYLTIGSREGMLETILSIDNSLLFKTRRQLIMKMRSIDFTEYERHDKHDFCWISFHGIIDNQIVNLKFSNNLKTQNDKSYYLIEKNFRKNFGICKLFHRDNDIPAELRYGFDESLYLAYHVDGEYKRTNPTDPTAINYMKDGVQYFYYKSEELAENEMHMPVVVIENDIIKSAVIHCGELRLSFEELTSIIPEMESYTLTDLVNINERLSIEQKHLIQMAKI